MTRQSWAIFLAAAAVILVCLVVLSRTEGALSISDQMFLTAVGLVAVALERIAAAFTARVERLERLVDVNLVDRLSEAAADRAASLAGERAVVEEMLRAIAAERDARITADTLETDQRIAAQERLLASIDAAERAHRDMRERCIQRMDDNGTELTVQVGELRTDLGVVRGGMALLVEKFIPEEDWPRGTKNADPLTGPVKTHRRLQRERKFQPEPRHERGLGNITPIVEE